IEASADSLAPALLFLEPQEILADLNSQIETLGKENERVPHANASHFELEDTLYWIACDQSVTPFQPFYKVNRIDDTGAKQEFFYVRADGKKFEKITRGAAGM